MLEVFEGVWVDQKLIKVRLKLKVLIEEVFEGVSAFIFEWGE